MTENKKDETFNSAEVQDPKRRDFIVLTASALAGVGAVARPGEAAGDSAGAGCGDRPGGGKCGDTF